VSSAELTEWAAFHQYETWRKQQEQQAGAMKGG
jgi:hypothetical protein